MVYVKVNDDVYKSSTGAFDVTVAGSGTYVVNVDGSPVQEHNSQQDARDAALALVHKLGALVIP